MDRKKPLAPIPPSAPRYADTFQSRSGVTVAYAEDRAKRHIIEEDGLCTMLYQYLHKTVKGKEKSLSTILIPETVIYEHNFPRAWYAYDEENSEIIQRPSRMLDAQTIFEWFSRVQKGSPVVAQFYYSTVLVEEEWESILTPYEKRTRMYQGQTLTYIEFFSAEALYRFLFQTPRKPDGVLQSFVLPKGDGSSRQNFQLHVLWSPLMTTVYRRTNRYRMDDHGVPLAQRTASYDGPAYLSEETLVADETKRQLTQLCNHIVEHFYDTEKKHITRMNLYFKTDDENRMWLLWCSSIRVGADSLHPSTLEVPVRLDMRTEVVNDGATSLEKLQLRRRRQKNLLALDYELFEVSRDLEFSLSVNASHKRQAKLLGLKGLPELMLGDDPKDPRCNPRHPLHPAFMLVCEPEDAALDAESLGRSPETVYNDDLDHDGSVDLYQVSPEDRVKSELVALAMDAWYEVYSTTLSDHPEVMPTSRVELASPLLEILTEEELEQLTELLGIRAVSEDDEEEEEASSETHGKRYVAVPYLVSPGRRLDRPSSQVEADIKNFFEDIFKSRGIGIVRSCLDKHSLYFS